MNIVIFGQKGTGKSTVGGAFASATGLNVFDTDAEIEALYRTRTGLAKTCREIFRAVGEAPFRALEREVALAAAGRDFTVVVTGGGLMLDPETRRALRLGAVMVYLRAEEEVLWERATKHGLPPWLEVPDGRDRFQEQTRHRDEVLRPFADLVLDTTSAAPEELAETLRDLVAEELAVR